MLRDTIHVEITYNAPVKRVWNALTERDQIRDWCFEVSAFDLCEGSEFEFQKLGSKSNYLHRCRIVEVVDETKLKYTWAYPGAIEGESVVTWELIPRGNVTSVRLTHEHLFNHEHEGATFDVDRFEAGWEDVLRKSLANFLEK